MSARLKAGHDQQERPVFDLSIKDIFLLAKHIRRAWLRARAGSQELGVPLAEYAASLRFQTSAPLTPQRGGHEPHLTFRRRSWWSLSGSNRRPEACKATALPAELRPLAQTSSTIMVGLGRLERPTSPLSGVRSNHLSYRPSRTGTIPKGHPGPTDVWM